MTDIPIPEEAVRLAAREFFCLFTSDPEAYKPTASEARKARKTLQAAAPTLYAAWVGAELERMAEEFEELARAVSGMLENKGIAYEENARRLRQRAATLRGGDGG